ncbi:MAG TPA: nitrilase family protein [Chitinophagaceae bacterium]|nr:nitrilase family protein [Chitinophagaceae bacterium]
MKQDFLLLYLNSSMMSSLTFTLVQTNLHWENKLANLIMLREKVLGIQEKTEVVVLPEMFSTGFSMQPELFAEKMDGEAMHWMKKLSVEKKVIITGSLIIEDNSEYYNRLIWMLPDGNYGYYNKRHLFAYGQEHEHYTAGSKRLIASVKGWKINLQVCYDLRFPVWARQQAGFSAGEVIENKAPEYDVLVYVANWPERRIHAWRTLLIARAIENQCYVVAVNRVGNDGNTIYHNGNSMVIGPLGDVLYEKLHEEDIFTITLEKDKLNEVRTKFPFWKDADKFIIANE